MERDDYFICEAITMSQESVDAGGYPAGAVIVKNDEIIARGLSNGKNECDATLHAEIDAIRRASKKLGSRSLESVTLYSSLEPCVMCFSACFWAYIPRVVYACARSQVNKDYYMGEHDIVVLNEKNYRRKVELIHHQESFESAIKVVREWEKNQNSD